MTTFAAVVFDQVLHFRNVVGRAFGNRVVEIVQVVEGILAVDQRHENADHDSRERCEKEDTDGEFLLLCSCS